MTRAGRALPAVFLLFGLLAAAPSIAYAQSSRAAAAGAISGRIADTAGDPLIGMTVSVSLATAPRRAIATSETDDRGEYRVGHLQAGQYIISVASLPVVLISNGVMPIGTAARNGLAPKDAEATSLRQVYYPGVQTLEGALPISLSAGEERASVDFATPVRPPFDEFGARTAKAPLPSESTNAAGIIRGQVLVDGRPSPRITVRALPDHDLPNMPNVPPAVTTDDDGRYEIRRLPPGVYHMFALKTGFLTSEYRQTRPSSGGEPIELRSAETRDRVDIALLRPSVVAGRVMNQRGDPVEGATVRLLQVRYRDGLRRLVDAGGLGTHRTDDRGMFRVYGLQPGEYVVSAAVGQAVTYSPGTGNPADAQRVRVDVGAEAAGVDVALVDPVTTRVAGTIRDAAGKPVQGGVILTRSRRGGGLVVDPVAARSSADGRFEFTNVAPGDYLIQAVNRDPRSQGSLYDEGESVSQPVSVARTDISGIELRMTRGGVVTGRLTFEGDVDPDLYSAVNISAIPVDFDRTPQNIGYPASASIQPDLTLMLAGLTGGRILRLLDPPPGWVLKAVLLNGRDITDTPMVFGGAQAVSGLEVVLTKRASEVTGRALDARARPMSGARVVIFPTDRQQWTETSRFVAASAQTKNDGSFTIGALPAGDYYVAAVAALEPGEWRDPDLLEMLIPDAAHVTISESDKASVSVRVVTR